MTASFVLSCIYIYVNSYFYAFFLDNYILASYFLLFYEMRGFPNKWWENDKMWTVISKDEIIIDKAAYGCKHNKTII